MSTVEIHPACKTLRWPVYVLGILLLGHGVTFALQAALRPLWFDETFTFYIAQFESWKTFWWSLSHSGDMTPPVGFLVGRLGLTLFGNGELGLRIPFILIFMIIPCALYRFVGRRTSPVYGLLAAVMSLRAFPYAYEARPYAIVLACSALALLCWSSAARGHKRKVMLPLLALLLILNVSCHLYAILVVLPFLAGETIRLWQRRRLDVAMLVTLSSPFPVLLCFWPIVRYGHSFCQGYFDPLRPLSWLGGYVQALLPWHLLLLVAIAVGPMWLWARRNTEVKHVRLFPGALTLPEWGVILGFALIPLFGFVGGLAFTHIYTARHMLAVLIGVAVLAGVGAHWAFDGSRRYGTILVLLVWAATATVQVKAVRQDLEAPRFKAELTRKLEALEPNAIVAMVSPGGYTMATRVIPPAWEKRLFYVPDPKAPLPIVPRCTSTRTLLELSHWAPIRKRCFRDLFADKETPVYFLNAEWVSSPWSLTRLPPLVLLPD